MPEPTRRQAELHLLLADMNPPPFPSLLFTEPVQLAAAITDNEPPRDQPYKPQLWFDRQGKPIDTATANDLLGKPAYVRVALTEITSATDPAADCRISTVWLALDQDAIWRTIHGQDHAVPPVLFETMVFGGHRDRERERWTTEDAARAGHAETVATLTSGLPDAHVQDITDTTQE
jgi:hypothetical protein